YVLAIGINHYMQDSVEKPLDLTYAEKDAREFADVFSADQMALGQFGSVKTIRLFSADATKANILAALSLLGGGPRDSLSDAQRALFEGIGAVQPEDGVFLFYAGHGGATSQHFYLLPTDYNSQTHLTSPESE